MTQTTTTVRNGMGPIGLLAVLLTVLFVALKLTGVIAWGWVAVLSPILIWLGIGVAFLIVLALIGLVLVLVAWRADR